MIQIQEEALIRSIEKAYKEYQSAIEESNHSRACKIYGWISALEKIIELYAPTYMPKIEQLRQTNSTDMHLQDLDTPTYLRRRK